MKTTCLANAFPPAVATGPMTGSKVPGLVKHLIHKGGHSMVSALTLLLATVFPGELFSSDLNWLRPGVRVWYIGAGSETDLEIAAIIDTVTNGRAVGRIQTAGNNWESSAAESVLDCPDVAQEGEFWIHPSRLAPLTTGDEFIWKYLAYKVWSNTSSTFNDLPIYAQLLPEMAMFAARSPRNIVRLNLTGSTVGDYWFDVETGLLVRFTQGTGSTAVSFSLAEINYDFGKRSAFAEDVTAPHTGFGAYYNATRSLGFMKGSQGAQFTIDVLSRMGGFMMARCLAIYNDTNTVPYSLDENLLYDSGTNVAQRCPANGGGSWTVNGDHLFCWIPPPDRARAAIRVWDFDLQKSGATATTTTFFNSVLHPTGGFQGLVFSNTSGYMTDFVVYSPAYGSWACPYFYVDSRSDPAKQALVFGRNYYLSSIGQAVPVAVALVNWRQLHFGTCENTGQAADGADPNHDGEVNLLEFATGQDPSARSSMACQVVPAAGQVEISYTRSQAALDDGVRFVVEQNNSLATGAWTTATVTESIEQQGTLQRVIARFPAAVNNRCFVRLRVSY